MAKTQLALQQLAVGVGTLQDAPLFVTFGVLGVQQDFPEISAHLVQFNVVVAKAITQMVIAENHHLTIYVLNVQVVRHGAHDFGPEAFSLLQG